MKNTETTRREAAWELPVSRKFYEYILQRFMAVIAFLSYPEGVMDRMILVLRNYLI